MLLNSNKLRHYGTTALRHYGTTALRHVKNAPTVGEAHFFACPRLVLLTVGDGRSSCLNGKLGKGEFLASCYSS
jgi:hypothetical protein